MKILIGCEFSGIVREAFKKQGHDVLSCDLIDTEIPGKHYKGDLMNIINSEKWDIGIFHPECTHLAVSGARWFSEKIKDGRQQEAINFFMSCINAKIDKICVENPISIMSTVYKKPTQIIQPYMFGHMEKKSTCLWLKNLPELIPTNNVYSEMLKLPKKLQNRIHYMSPGPDRNKNRSRTYFGIAEAMSEQWG